MDVVIPYGPNDSCVINDCINYAKKNVKNLRNIFVISFSMNFKHPDATVLHESIYPFSFENIRSRGFGSRTGWYLQQLIKLYAWQVIDGISEWYLVLDSDTFVLKPTDYVSNDDTVGLFTVGMEVHPPYFTHMQRLLPGFTKVTQRSGICHHMVMKQSILQDLFDRVEKAHPNKKFWQAFLDCVDSGERLNSGASEYEIYFNFCLKYHPTKIQYRKLNWRNVTRLTEITDAFDYVSYHHYSRK